MMKELHLSIVSPEKSVFDGEVKIVTLPGTVGSFSILPGHAPIVSSLKAGTLGYTTMDGEGQLRCGSRKEDEMNNIQQKNTTTW